ncbi:type IV toxin-antitoxin system AbiEi family antitoxin domain-containing protein [Agromyces aerolatus]|uniref:type IV toxin-antitoxin system AbiEi family antitoxin domain-containing protein n=1 Tax=Agromyces sp. LY-1074 TaxID=3074080 RepID=UPI00285C2C73|nr:MULTISPECIES: type IV toxin-antitoxin system AbiEi family antitoxin domain-containing protein [unclassified Agromyces]MDR5698496.1 type IV toxin-antitoxin system AbiEi family antitoxin domain-containing protein [Agromyces sp. LY-1074]MDR5704790.1 type IV toxin-antitoxin system AbiEi family antitoxin domain-containing protein [Agromyces sp. LY-1358]
MESRVALRVLAEVTESQWGLVTSAQALARGVSHMNLARLVDSGDLIRLAHGVYRDAGAPGPEHEELHAAWLATEPKRLAYERLADRPPSAVVSGESAASLHAIGNLRATRSELTTATRRQTRRTDVHYRTRKLPAEDVTVRGGLPVTTRERTIADLVETREDLTNVGNALRDAVNQSELDTSRLAELLAPLAERNGHRRGDGAALLAELFRIAGIDRDGVIKRIAAVPELSARITVENLERLAKVDVSTLRDPAHRHLAMTLQPLFEQLAVKSEELRRALESVGHDRDDVAAGADGPALAEIRQVADAMTSADWARLASALQLARPPEEIDHS